MRKIVRIGIVAAMLVIAGRSMGEMLPSFQHEPCAWEAAEIVVVAQKGDTVTVLETWKGSLARGTTIRGLDLPAPPVEIMSWDSKAPRKTVSGSKIVLFLRHEERDQVKGELPEWVGVAYHGGMRESAAWLDGGQAYAIQQLMNPGPAGLSPLEKSEDKFKQETMEVVAAKEALARALLIADAGDRVQALAPMAGGKYWHQRREALAAMGECGAAALPALRTMLREYRNETPQIAGALARAAGDKAGEEMTGILKEEVAFWKKTAPGLPVGWWNSLQENRQLYQNRYCVLGPAVGTIASLGYQEGKATVRELRDLWVSLPQLNDKSGLDQITEACNKALEALGEPGGAAVK